MGQDAVTEDLEDLYEYAPCGYISLGPDGRIVKSNATLSAWIGFAPEELCGKRLRDLLNIAGAIFYETHFAPLLRMQGFFHEVALDIVTKDGGKVAVLANAVERRDEAENLLFTRVTIFKATERRRYERELVEARTKAERALHDERATAELRDQFIAVLGHDLRNPLAAIAAGLKILRREPDGEKAARALGLMEGSVLRMTGLINNILDFARGRLGGGIVLERRVLRLEPILEQVIDELSAVSPENRIVKNLVLPQPVDCDPTRIGQLVSNLLGNALVHGDPATPVTIEASAGATGLVIAIANGGSPIPPEAMERLFQPFFRAEVRSSRQGLGLGLHIAFEIARAHGGSIAVTSTSAETRFTFTMPLTPTGGLSEAEVRQSSSPS